MSNPNLLTVALALPGEGATYVKAKIDEGLATDHAYDVSLFVLHNTIDRDGVTQTAQGGRTHNQYLAAGSTVTILDKHDDGQTLPVYTQADLEALDAAISGRGVVTPLEEYPFPALFALNKDRKLPPIVPNLFRSGLNKQEKSPHLVATLLREIASGAITRATVDAYASRDTYVSLGVPEDVITVVPNGVDLDKFKPSAEARARTRAELDIPNDDETPVILLIARDSGEKDIPLFLKSTTIYLKANPNGHVMAAGYGLGENDPHMAELMDTHLGDLTAEQRKRFHAYGQTDSLELLYPAATVLALTSATESRPLCITEAFACGVPVAVSTDVGDARVMIGKHGFIANTREPQEMADLWAKATTDKEKLAFPLAQRAELGTRRMVDGYNTVIRAALATAR